MAKMETEEEQIVALLHDVIEDPGYTARAFVVGASISKWTCMKKLHK